MVRRVPAGFLWAAPLCGGALLFCGQVHIDVYGQTGFDSVLFSLFSGVDDVQSGLITAFLEEALFPAAVATVLVGGVFWFAPDRRIVLRLGKKVRVPIFPMHRAVSGLLSAAFCGGCAISRTTGWIGFMMSIRPRPRDTSRRTTGSCGGWRTNTSTPMPRTRLRTWRRLGGE